MSMHHYRCIALWFMNISQKGRFWAASLASGSSTPNEDKMLQTFWIRVQRGLTGGLLQLSGSCANRVWLATANSFIRVTCPNTESWRDLTMEESVGCWLIQRTAPFPMKSCQRVSKAPLIQCNYSLYICLLDHPAFWSVQYTTITVLWPFVRDYPGEPVLEETLTHPPSWSSSNLYQLIPPTTIHSILLVP